MGGAFVEGRGGGFGGEGFDEGVAGCWGRGGRSLEGLAAWRVWVVEMRRVREVVRKEVKDRKPTGDRRKPCAREAIAGEGFGSVGGRTVGRRRSRTTGYRVSALRRRTLSEKGVAQLGGGCHEKGAIWRVTARRRECVRSKSEAIARRHKNSKARTGPVTECTGHSGGPLSGQDGGGGSGGSFAEDREGRRERWKKGETGEEGSMRCFGRVLMVPASRGRIWLLVLVVGTRREVVGQVND